MSGFWPLCLGWGAVGGMCSLPLTLLCNFSFACLRVHVPQAERAPRLRPSAPGSGWLRPQPGGTLLAPQRPARPAQPAPRPACPPALPPAQVSAPAAQEAPPAPTAAGGRGRARMRAAGRAPSVSAALRGPRASLGQPSAAVPGGLPRASGEAWPGGGGASGGVGLGPAAGGEDAGQ